MNITNMYHTKEDKYFKGVRYDVINIIPEGESRILEVGCGSGATLLRLKEIGKANFIMGIDIIEFEEQKKLDKFIMGDIETIDVSNYQDYFDVIICADVLEHLKDPWETTKKLANCLKPNGILVASIPNIREISTIYKIVIKGDFKYEDSGILDKTHLRFFCKKNVLQLFKNADLEVEQIKPSFLFWETRGKRYWLNKLTFNFFHEFFTPQFLIVARKK
ncbi:class I SAM-dependent methyltransferase [Caldicellulosiruptor changbaiensis]|uniref:Class I SAM-dependent methyltransferase n=1 Tax=Caldicellulosiruptor changbaiensis TaxID=1222016 RepID=A0A3T0D9E4_9FIRM|nr:class I SAM-dependent methyltransferase [Caldicellulosiruptor changbaiensis]AZT91539.1 class I SAM-dependent methyltransferase [Caldicellulosiruptor changbaiensis]